MQLRKQWLVMAIAVPLVFTTVGCAMNNKKPQSTQRPNTQQVRYDERMNDANNNTGYDTNTRVGQKMRTADDVSDNLVKLREIDAATTVVMGDTAYIGVSFAGNYQGGMTNELKNKVAKRARKVDSSLRRVYVSANPGFVDAMKNYAKSVRDGRPISGLINGFMDLVQRTFPTSQ
ncbi:sporulation lipoprotein, YhcN/YlaJ family [Marininema mesophilum]|uniref:Sporulation lipoprotein, YhcN/YlaJ family n=1 Tax=Marininema mesophilum TaxID=1048340 RepID=A0A1H2QYY7_9BACL|nr:YhcN/YlaJ family sporulation lipoprotein [Marininema mesophilum]SDW12422.1 sporulation lipoprotein, YhcN/YlaJ family [Marininema mesophilum]